MSGGSNDYINYISQAQWEGMPILVDEQDIPQHNPGAKLDDGKEDMSLLLDFGLALQRVAAVGAQGVSKYTKGGWQFAPQGIIRYTAALLRHLFDERYEFSDGEIRSGHAAQVAWNALARLELLERQRLGILPEDLRTWEDPSEAE